MIDGSGAAGRFENDGECVIPITPRTRPRAESDAAVLA
jgi:hypothetical protein